MLRRSVEMRKVRVEPGTAISVSVRFLEEQSDQGLHLLPFILYFY